MNKTYFNFLLRYTSRLILFVPLMAILVLISFAPTAWAFCGFYVAKADTRLYNQASQVIIARDGTKTVLTMANDFQGDIKDFAVVVPVPRIIQEHQVRVPDPKIIQRLDAFTAPRLVEYFDQDPCRRRYYNSPGVIPETGTRPILFG
jgi:hypothetical protein